MDDLSGLGKHQYEGSQIADFGGKLPLLGGTRPPSVSAYNIELTSASTILLFHGRACYLAGPQQIIENGGNAIVVDFYDGDPSGSDYQIIGSISADASSAATLDLTGVVLFVKNGLYIKATGTTPNATVILLCNY